jgi:succinate dehydrogenase/fumarate reductase flavoprotein subunit
LVRDAGGLREALDGIKQLQERHRRLKVRNSGKIYNYELTTHFELGSMLALAEVVAEAAQARTESRGAHNRRDFPNPDDANWKSHTIASFAKGSVQIDKRPVAS